MKAIILFAIIQSVLLWHGATCQMQQIGARLSGGNTQSVTRNFSSTISEGGSVRFCITSGGDASDLPSTLIAQTNIGSASDGDFASMEETEVTFTTTDQTWCIWLFASIDSITEGAENFFLMVRGQTGRYRNDNIRVIVSVTDTEFQGPAFSVAQDNYVVSEDDDSVQVCVGYYGGQPLRSATTLELSAVDSSQVSQGSKPLTFPANSQPGTLECADVEKVPNEETFGVVLQSPSGAAIAHLTSTTVRVVDPESATLVARGSTPSNGGTDNDGGNDGGTTNNPSNGDTDNGGGNNDGVIEGGLNNGGVSSTCGASTILSLLVVTLTVIVSSLIE